MIDEKLLTSTLSYFTPKYQGSLSKWANQNVILSSEFSNEIGRYEWERTPYIKEILDAFTNPDISQISVKCSAQVGKTLTIMIMIGYIIQEDPSPILLVFPDKELAGDFSTEKLDPFIRETGNLSTIIYDDDDIDKKKKGLKILKKKFPGGSLIMVGSNSISGLSSKTIKYVFIDELHQCHPHTTDQAKKRSATYDDAKLVVTSTPGEKSTCRITAEYEQSDQRRPFVPCPKCKQFQILRFDQLKFSKKTPVKKIVDNKPVMVWVKEEFTPYYECEFCKYQITHREKFSMLDKMKWVAENPEEKEHAGFWVNALYSPFETWEKIVQEWKKVTQSKSKERLRIFRNLYLGEAWEDEGEQINKSELYSQREDFLGFDIPKHKKETILTCGVDVQRDRLEGEVVAWGQDMENWAVEYFVIHGDPQVDAVWNELHQKLQTTYKNLDEEQKILCTLIDSGDGPTTNQVYKFVKPRQSLNIFASKGESESKSARIWKPVISRKSKLANGIRLLLIGTNSGKLTIKDLTQNYEGITRSHYPKKDCYDDYYFSMLTAESLIEIKDTSGYEYKTWRKTRPRNEALDIRVLNLAAYLLVNPNFDKLNSQAPPVPRKPKSTPGFSL